MALWCNTGWYLAPALAVILVAIFLLQNLLQCYQPTINVLFSDNDSNPNCSDYDENWSSFQGVVANFIYSLSIGGCRALRMGRVRCSKQFEARPEASNIELDFAAMHKFQSRYFSDRHDSSYDLWCFLRWFSAPIFNFTHLLVARSTSGVKEVWGSHLFCLRTHQFIADAKTVLIAPTKLALMVNNSLLIPLTGPCQACIVASKMLIFEPCR
jgi:hypothetical protein